MARPKRTFTDNEIKEMCQHALNGGQNNTIAVAMNIPFNTLKRRFGKILTQKRAIRKLKLRAYQTKQAKSSADMSKFLGKNELDQVDKQEIKTITEVYKPTPAEEEAAQAAAKVYKLKLAE